MSKFFNGLKGLIVIKAAIVYLVVAWIIIQVAAAVLPTFGAADWVRLVINNVLAIGLPIWVIISWIQDTTLEGIANTTEASENSGRALSEYN